MGSKTTENREKRTGKDRQLRRLFNLFKFNLGWVDCISGSQVQCVRKPTRSLIPKGLDRHLIALISREQEHIKLSSLSGGYQAILRSMVFVLGPELSTHLGIINLYGTNQHWKSHLNHNIIFVPEDQGVNYILNAVLINWINGSFTKIYHGALVWKIGFIWSMVFNWRLNPVGNAYCFFKSAPFPNRYEL